MTRAVFLGSSDSVFSNRHFGALADSDCRIVAVVDVPPARRASTNTARPEGESFVQAALSRGIPVFEPVRPNAPELVAELRALSPDLFVAAGYMLLLGKEILSVPRVVAANFHASLLPAYRGKHPVFRALRNGERLCGLTVHVMDPRLDAGDIIFQVRERVRPRDSVAALYDRIMAKSLPLVARLVDRVEKGRVPRRAQPTEGASYYGSLGPEDFRLDWARDARALARWIAVSPGQCFAECGSGTVYFLDGQAVRRPRGAAAGTCAALDPGGCVIAAGRGALRVRRVRGDDGAEKDALEAFAALGARAGSPLNGGAACR